MGSLTESKSNEERDGGGGGVKEMAFAATMKVLGWRDMQTTWMPISSRKAVVIESLMHWLPDPPLQSLANLGLHTHSHISAAVLVFDAVYPCLTRFLPFYFSKLWIFHAICVLLGSALWGVSLVRIGHEMHAGDLVSRSFGEGWTGSFNAGPVFRRDYVVNETGEIPLASESMLYIILSRARDTQECADGCMPPSCYFAYFRPPTFQNVVTTWAMIGVFLRLSRHARISGQKKALGAGGEQENWAVQAMSFPVAYAATATARVGDNWERGWQHCYWGAWFKPDRHVRMIGILQRGWYSCCASEYLVLQNISMAYQRSTSL